MCAYIAVSLFVHKYSYMYDNKTQDDYWPTQQATTILQKELDTLFFQVQESHNLQSAASTSV